MASRGRIGVELLVGIVVCSLVAGSLLGQPVLLSYVTTGSMSPTLSAGDGFVAVPAQLSGSVEEGDVVVYRAEELHGGGLTTHRVVDVTDRGYVTRGDANPFTDQDSGEPPVTDAQVVAEALTVGGHVVVIPGFGTAVETLRAAVDAAQRRLVAVSGMRSLLDIEGLALSFGAMMLLWYVVDGWRGRTDAERTRDRERATGRSSRLVVGALVGLVVVAATAAMVVPAGTHEYAIVSAEFDADRPDVVPVGESSTRSYTVENTGLVPVVVSVEPASGGVDVRPQRLTVPPRSERTVTVTLRAPERTGYYRRYVVERRYLAVLPGGAIRALASVHPWLALLVVDGVVALAFFALARGLVGTGRLRSREREPDRPLSTRLRRAGRTLYGRSTAD